MFLSQQSETAFFSLIIVMDLMFLFLFYCCFSDSCLFPHCEAARCSLLLQLSVTKGWLVYRAGLTEILWCIRSDCMIKTVCECACVCVCIDDHNVVFQTQIVSTSNSQNVTSAKSRKASLSLSISPSRFLSASLHFLPYRSATAGVPVVSLRVCARF